MRKEVTSISTWLGITGACIAIVGAIQDKNLIVILGAILLLGLLISLIYTRRLKEHINKANIEVEGIRIDSLNLANLSRRQNKTLSIKEATHTARISQNDLIVTFDYSGVCKSERGENGLVFSVEAGKYIPFRKLECYGFDLINDPNKKHKISPLPQSPNGISKKIKLPFAKPIKENQEFHVQLHYTWPDCMNYGTDYFASTLSFKDKRISKYLTCLEFERDFPLWVRVYEVVDGMEANLIGDLAPIEPINKNSNIAIYEDSVMNTCEFSARIYLFERIKK